MFQGKKFKSIGPFRTEIQYWTVQIQWNCLFEMSDVLQLQKLAILCPWPTKMITEMMYQFCIHLFNLKISADLNIIYFI